MPIELFPRLYTAMAESRWEEIKERDLQELERLAGVEHPIAAAGETGGIPVNRDRLQGIRDAVVNMAKDAGYPDVRNTAEFDVACTRYLCDQASIPEVEAYRDEVWSFLALVLLPDIAVWRFPNRPKERMLGGVRNTFQRLWLRGRLIAVGDDRHEPDWELISELTEDAFVAVIERPRLSASPLLAREFAEGWRRCSSKHKGNMESVHRIASRNLMASKTVINLEALEHDLLQELINKHFEQAVHEVDASLG